MSILKRAISLLLCGVMLTSILSSCTTEESHDHETDTPSTEQQQNTTPDAKPSDDETSENKPHTHKPATAVSENAVEATCIQEGSYDEVVYCSECQEELSRTQKTVEKKPHDHSQKITTSEYLKTAATCTDSAVYYYSCECGDKGTASFRDGEPADHTFDQKSTLYKYLKSDATEDSPAIYYYSCICGQKGTTTFTSGNALEHIHTVVVDPAVEATCTNTGLTEGKHCSICLEVIVPQTRVPKKAHTEVIDPAVASTCTKTGLTQGKHCKVCNEVLIAQQETPKIEHTYDNIYDENCNVCGFKRDAECAHTETVTVKGYAATCTAKGLTNGTKCKKCGEILTAQVEIPMKAHTEVIDKAVSATCTTTGLTQGKHCSVCNKVIVAQTVVPVKAHTEVIDSAVAATCTETGLTEGKHCSVCNKTLVAQQETPKVAHTYDDKYDETCNKCGFVREAECTHINTEIIPGRSATCTSTGLTDGAKCKKCGEIVVKQTVIPMKAHTEVLDPKVDATCTATGLTEGKHCSVCNKIILAQNVVPIKPHTNGTPVTENFVDSTCKANGTYNKVVYCSVCGYELSRSTIIIEKKPHTEVIEQGVNPTCTATGLTDGKYCSMCNEILLVQKSIPATGHSMDNWIQIKEPTCTVSGIDKRKCTKCDHYETRAINPKGHSYASIVTAPTCTIQGYTTYTCTCGHSYKDNYTPASGHSYINHGAKAPTCTGIGWDAYVTCSRCDYTTYKEKNALGHTKVIDIAVAPTCTETGLTEGMHCSVCNVILVKQTIVGALGHDEIEHNAQAPTCIGIGWDEYITCSRCVYTTYVEKAALGHKKSGTCITCGYIVISTATELKNISSKLDGKYVLMNNINLGRAEWTPIGNYSSSFKGIFDGNGYVISNFVITNSSRVGLFTYNDGTIENLGLTNFTINVNSGGCAGGLAAVNRGSLINCYATGKVSISTSNYYAYNDFTSRDYAGGLVGSNAGNITNCYATGSVSLSSHGVECYGYIGGLVGSNSGTITNCYETASVSSSARHINYAGGLVGYNDGGSITQCYATGSVSSNSSSSSKSGVISDNTGGLVGYNVKGTITNCYAKGFVSSHANNYNYIANGGLVGSNDRGTIGCCYATGSVSSIFGSELGGSYSGGLVGSNSGNIKNCYGAGNVTGSSSNASKYTVNPFFAGGLVGGYGTITNCYRYSGQQITLKNNGTTVYGNTNANGTVKEMHELQSSSFYADTIDWPTDIWTFVEGEYPTLKNSKAHNYNKLWMTDESQHWYECLNCGHKKYMNSHIEGEWTVVKEATCTEPGYATCTCFVCGYSFMDAYVDATGHVWSDATCTTTKICTKCSKIGDLGHIVEVDAAVAPTCTKTGLTEGKHCSVCNEVLVPQAVVPAINHIENNMCQYCGIVIGICGDNVTWEYADGILTIRGTGDMADYASVSPTSFAPWYDYRSSITMVIIDDGVTSIGNYAFAWCTHLMEINIPSSVTSIGDKALFSCTRLAEITITSNVVNIGDCAFQYCSNLINIKYCGTEGQWDQITKGANWNSNNGIYTITYNC